MIRSGDLSIFINDLYIKTPEFKVNGYIDIPLTSFHVLFKSETPDKLEVLLEEELNLLGYLFDKIDLRIDSPETYNSKGLLMELGVVDTRFYRVYKDQYIDRINKDEFMGKAQLLIEKYKKNSWNILVKVILYLITAIIVVLSIVFH